MKQREATEAYSQYAARSFDEADAQDGLKCEQLPIVMRTFGMVLLLLFSFTSKAMVEEMVQEDFVFIAKGRAGTGIFVEFLEMNMENQLQDFQTEFALEWGTILRSYLKVDFLQGLEVSEFVEEAYVEVHKDTPRRSVAVIVGKRPLDIAYSKGFEEFNRKTIIGAVVQVTGDFFGVIDRFSFAPHVFGEEWLNGIFASVDKKLNDNLVASAGHLHLGNGGHSTIGMLFTSDDDDIQAWFDFRLYG